MNFGFDLAGTHHLNLALATSGVSHFSGAPDRPSASAPPIAS